MTKFRLITNGKEFNYQEQLPDGGWWTASYANTEAITRAHITQELEREAPFDTFRVVEEFDSNKK